MRAKVGRSAVSLRKVASELVFQGEYPATKEDGKRYSM
jgi:hypothetical protein